MKPSWIFWWLLVGGQISHAEPKLNVLERYGTSCLPQLAIVARLPHGFWTRDKVIAAIQALHSHKKKICLLNKVLLNDRSEATAMVIEKALEEGITGAQLVIAARSFFKTWPEAVEAAGHRYEDLEVLYGTRVWTKRRILKAIRMLGSFGIDIGVTAMGHDRRNSTGTLLTQAFGFRHPDGTVETINGQALYGAACKSYGSWPAALKAAGLDSSSWNRRGEWSERSILAVIKQLHENKTPLNIWSVMRDNSIATIEIIETHAKFPASGNALTQAAVRRFGSWDKALLAAGINPKDVRKYRASFLPDNPTGGQLEFWTGAKQETRGGFLVGATAENPADVAYANELQDTLTKIAGQVKEPQRTLTISILEIVVTSDNLSTPASISRQLEKEFGVKATPGEVKKVLANFGKLWPLESPE